MKHCRMKLKHHCFSIFIFHLLTSNKGYLDPIGVLVPKEVLS
jgi:hypothetical protein